MGCVSTKKKVIITPPQPPKKKQFKYQDRVQNDLDQHSTHLTNYLDGTQDKLIQYKEVDAFLKDYKFKSLAQEKEFVLNLIKLPDHTHVISYKWACLYTDYITGTGRHPGPIDNEELAQKIRYKQDSLTEKDYVKIHEQVWLFLLQIYKGGPCISITEIEQQSSESLQNQQRQIKIKEIGIVGLENDIYFCYLNSVLQCFMGLQELNQMILNQNINEDKPFLFSYSSLLKRVQRSRMYSVVTPKEFQKSLQKMFSIYEMHDSSELLLFLLDKFREEMMIDNSTFIEQLFLGQMTSSIQCPNCNKYSYKTDEFYDLSLPLTEKVIRFKKLQLIDCISMYFKEEVIEGDWVCGECEKRAHNVKRKLRITQSPSVLILHLKRFTVYPQQKKIREPVQIEMEIDLKNHCEGVENSKYQLQSMIVHSGTIDQGHYVAIVKRNQLFYIFNDEEIDKIGLNEISKVGSAYLLMYHKIN